jgi:hypothetical protein
MHNFNFKNKNKNAFFSLSLILLLATTLMMTFAQPASGQAGVPQPEKTAGYITVAPTLIGVGQTLTCNAWVFPLPTTYNYGPYFNGFYGVTVTFIKPDGTKDTFMPTDGTGAYVPGQMQSLGALFFFYKPSMAGNWSVSWTMPAQNITDSSGTVLYTGCTSNTAHFTVQTDPVLAGLLNGYPWAELPNSNVYWSYPINANNREWGQISGEWTGLTSTMANINSPTQLRWQPYGPGPSTPHIVWDQPFKSGGLIGGAYGSFSYGPQGSAAIMGGSASLVNFAYITQGKVFVNVPGTLPVGGVVGQFRCYDLATGQVLYTANGSVTGVIHVPGNALMQNTNAAAQNQSAVILESSFGSDYTSYLYGTQGSNWNYYDPLTGTLVITFVNATSSRPIDGTVLAFGAGTITGQTGRYVYRWNMTSVANNNWPTGITWKVPLPTTLTGAYPSLFAVSPDLSAVVLRGNNQYWGYNADTGAKLWNITIPYAITSNEAVPLGQVNDFIVWDATAATWHCYSETTGTELWETPSVASSPWATTWTVYYCETNDLNNLYIPTPDGTVRAFSLTDGHLVWQSTAIPTTEHTENVIPLVTPGTILMGGYLYVYAGYSLGYQINPVPRFSELLCINATTGDIAWTLNGAQIPNAAANGVIIATSIFDGNLYAIGKGTTSTTVMAQQQVGGSVLIQGSVFDNSPASYTADVTAKFPNGVPAISDANMSVWMDYLHMQNSTLLNNPPQCTGVPVTLTAMDPNGNTITIGTTTSDASGTFGYQWNPTTPGLYKIFASFTGSDSYYQSFAETRATVASATSSAAPTSATQPIIANSDIVTYLVIAVVAIIIAIAINIVITLRKKA